MGFVIFAVVLLLVVACIAAFVGQQGMWGAALTFFSVLLAALLATNYWEPATRALDDLAPSYTYLLDYLVLWGLFGLFLVPLRLATDFASRVKVKFLPAVDIAGGYFFALLTAWTFVGFMMMTLHTAPLARNFLGFFQPEPESHMLGVGPDRKWLAFMQAVSTGALSQGNTFDPNAEFILKYGQRRADFEKEAEFRVNR